MFNNFFDNIVPNLKILTNHNCNIDFQKTDNPVLKTKKQKTKKTVSIVMIKSKIEAEIIYSFTPLQYQDILRKTKNLNVSKASQQSHISTKILINKSKYFSCYFDENIN